MVTFKDFNLSKDTFVAITNKGFKTPSEIQEKVIPVMLKQEKDIVAIAQTGTGKTAAFGLPLVDLVPDRNKFPKAIILAPTRELALQVTKELETYTNKKRLRIITVYGGASISMQTKLLRDGADIVVGTPGRVVDMIDRKILRLHEIKHFVLDEADEMLKMGFIEDIELILSKADKSKKVYLFSATMPKQIKELSKQYMREREIIEVKHNQQIHSELIDQKFYVVERYQKSPLLTYLVKKSEFFYGIVFCKTKSDVDKLTRELRDANIKADCIHGDIAQNKRERILQKFRDQKIDVLVATDVAARGIDVNNITHVVNHSLPQSLESYTHRIGRTGRAGNKGEAIAFIPRAEVRRLKLLEKETGFKLQEVKLPEQVQKAPKKANNSFDRPKKFDKKKQFHKKGNSSQDKRKFSKKNKKE